MMIVGKYVSGVEKADKKIKEVIPSYAPNIHCESDLTVISSESDDCEDSDCNHVDSDCNEEESIDSYSDDSGKQ